MTLFRTILVLATLMISAQSFGAERLDWSQFADQAVSRFGSDNYEAQLTSLTTEWNGKVIEHQGVKGEFQETSAFPPGQETVHVYRFVVMPQVQRISEQPEGYVLKLSVNDSEPRYYVLNEGASTAERRVFERLEAGNGWGAEWSIRMDRWVLSADDKAITFESASGSSYRVKDEDFLEPFVSPGLRSYVFIKK